MDADRLREIQHALQEETLDGWLFYDFRGSDPLAYRILGLDETELSTRRWYYFIPAEGAPVGLVSTIEPYRLDSLFHLAAAHRTPHRAAAQSAARCHAVFAGERHPVHLAR